MKKNYDVVIIGSGIAGLYAALNLDPRLRVLLVSKRELMLNNSSLAQGGVASVLDTVHDSKEAHFQDTMVAGGQKNNPEAVRILVEEGPDDVRRIMEYGVEFDKTSEGELHFTLEGGHSKPRIVHHKDATGREIVEKLLMQVKKLPHVEILENTLTANIKKGKDFHFDLIHQEEHLHVSSHFCVMASGGIGRVYEYTTNSKIATGDGIAFAYEMGAKIRNLHLIQFHPTGFANKLTRETFLISESVRGEGAHLLNCHGERFMQKYDSRLELAPRDVVSHFIMEEQKATGSDEFFLDISYKDPDFIKKRFPMIYQNLLKEGIDMTKDKIPVYPCHHYLMGGIDVDLNGKTSLDQLYAAGECSHTGVHGNNRLASNSLLEGLVFSRRAAKEINRLSSSSNPAFEEGEFPEDIYTEPCPAGIRTETRAIMQKAYFVNPDLEEAKKGFEKIKCFKQMLADGKYRLDIDYVEAKSLVTVAYLILKEVLTGQNETAE